MLKVILPNKPEYRSIAEGKKKKVFRVKTTESEIEIVSLVDWEINREFHNLTTKQFRKLFKEAKVIDGKKKMEVKNEIIVFEAKKNSRLEVRLSKGELKFIKKQ